ncbi:hypothetical protein FRAHR75_20154 [Frankia sp. Hr75.2]|nr:hypothetical protein FRAHR75_20154 [Frankia sp. Hr75.2]
MRRRHGMRRMSRGDRRAARRGDVASAVSGCQISLVTHRGLLGCDLGGPEWISAAGRRASRTTRELASRSGRVRLPRR